MRKSNRFWVIKRGVALFFPAVCVSVSNFRAAVQVGPRACCADRMINRAKKIKYLNQFELHTLIAQQDMGLQRRGRFPACEKQALCEEDIDWPAVTH